MAEKYTDIEQISIEKLFDPQRFRLITKNCMDIPGGSDELPVLLTLRDDFMKKVPYYLPSAGRVHGFAGICNHTEECNGIRSDYRHEGKLKQITINDWSDTFVVVFEYKNDTEKAFYVAVDEVLALMTEAMVPAYMRDKNYSEE